MRHHHLRVPEEAGAKPVIGVRHEGLEAERARGGIGGRPDPAHVPDEGLAREGVDADPHLLSGAQRRHLALGHVATEFQRIVLHQAEHHRPRPDVVAGIDQPGRHRSLEGRANRHPIELDAELVASGTGHLQGRPDLFVLLRRDDPLGAQRAGARLVRHRFLETGLRLAETCGAGCLRRRSAGSGGATRH